MKLKLKMTTFITLLLVITLFGNVNYIKANAKNLDNNKYIDSIKNVKVKTEGTLLNINSKIIKENGKCYRILESGKNIEANIKIKDSKITGTLNNNGAKYFLVGSLDEENEKYVGNITNLYGYTFEAYITDITSGNIIINVFNKDGKPESFIIDGNKTKVSKTEIQDNNISLKQTMLNNISPMTVDYFEPIMNVSTRGIYYSIEGPRTNVTRGTWQHRINIRTLVDNAWEDSGINNYIHYGSFVINNNINFHPTDSGSNYTAVYPASNGSTDFTFVFYFGERLGFWTIPVKTSTTTVSPSNNDINFYFSWTPAIAYLDEVNSTYSGEKSYGSEVNWSTNNTGYRTNSVTVTLQYEVIGKKTEYSPNTIVYPSYSDTSYYGITVN